MRLIYPFALCCLLLAMSVISGKAQVVAGFTASPTSGCPPLVVAFTNTTTPSTGNTYLWNLDNGTGPITLTDPGTTYLTSGTYTVTLTATHGTATSTHSQVITVYPVPVIHFTASDTAVCPGVPVTFTSTTIGGVPGPVSLLWSFGDGYTASTTPFAHPFSLPGHFSITLNATNSVGCTSILTKPSLIHIFTPPTAGFSAPITHFCNPPDVVTFNSAPTGTPPFSYVWTFGDGSPPSTIPYPSHTYSTLGTFTPSLSITDGHGCTGTNALPGYITESAFLALFTSVDTACINQPVYYANTSSAFTTCHWDFGDGASSNAINGVHTYTAIGTYTVALSIFNGTCYDTIRHTTVIPARNASYSVSPVHPCPAPMTATFTANVPPGATVIWDFGDSLTGTGHVVPHNYAYCKFDTVKMYVTHSYGCRDTAIDLYKIYDLNFIVAPKFFETLGGCAPFSAHLNPITFPTIKVSPPVTIYPYPSTNYWYFGDGSSGPDSGMVTHLYSLPGIYYGLATAHTANGCTISDSFIVTAGNKPSVTFTAIDRHQCYNHNAVKFTRTLLSGQADRYYWMFGEDFLTSGTLDSVITPVYNIVHTFDEPGTFSDTLIAYDRGCPDTFIRKDYVVIDSPQAKATYHVNCALAHTATFEDLSLGGNTRLWMFGDGATSTLKNPTHVYPSNDLYPASLATYNIASGCRDTFFFFVNLTRPTVTFTAPDTAICRDQYVTITASISGGFEPYYQWFAEGNAALNNKKVFVDTFHTIGIYPIKLVIVDQNLCLDTFVRNNYIHVSKPVANYTVTPASVCWPQAATFTDASSNITGAFISGTKWDFGDSTSASTGALSIAHAYTAAGTYAATQIVTDNVGCKDTIVHSLVSVYKPTAGFTANNTLLCLNVGTVFNNLSSPAAAYSWSFGDGATSTAKSPVHAYTATGIYTVRLIITDVHGCRDTLTKPGYISVTKPTAAFTASDSVAICPPLAVHFTNASSGATNYKWYMGNGDSSNAVNPNSLFTISAYDTVTMIAIDLAGCRDTATRHIKIYGYAGAFSYGPDSGCVPYTVHFNADLSSLALVSGITWDFGNGITYSSSLLDTISHTYLTAGSFVPKLVISDHAGCTKSNLGIDTVRVDDVRQGFTATPDPVCLGDSMVLRDTSTSYWSHIAHWSWNFNALHDTTPAPAVTYTAVGTFPISLQVTDGWGCSALISKNISVRALPAISITPDSNICIGATATLTDSTTGGFWTSHDPAVGTIAAGSGLFTGITAGVALITYSMGTRCQTTATVTVNPYPDPGFIVGKLHLCKDDTTLFTDTVTGGIWSGTGAFTTISAAGLVYARNPGQDTIFYTVSRLGCTSIATKIITVNPLPGAGTITGLDTICRGAVITLTDSTGHGFWTSSAPLIATADSTTGIVTGMNLGTAIITYTTSADTNGCSGKSTFSVTVINPDFSVSGSVVPDKCYASSDGSIAITITGGAPPFQYLWSTGGTSANITNLSAGTYSVKITESETQCIITDTFTVAAPDSLTLTADVISDVCLTHNGSIAITASGGTPPYQYQWSTGSTGSQLGGLGVGIYTVTVTDINGCTSLLPIPVVDSSCPSIIIHDAISPNGDGINDTWIIEGLSHYPGNTVQVFDKWGDLVYEHDNYQNDWACTGKNGLVPDGTYYYLIKLNKYKTPDGRNSFTGSLLVKR